MLPPDAPADPQGAVELRLVRQRRGFKLLVVVTILLLAPRICWDLRERWQRWPDELPRGGILFEGERGAISLARFAQLDRDADYPDISWVEPDALVEPTDAVRLTGLRRVGDSVMAWDVARGERRLVGLDPCGGVTETLRDLGPAETGFSVRRTASGRVVGWILRPLPVDEGPQLAQVLRVRGRGEVVALDLPPARARGGLSLEPGGRRLAVQAADGTLEVHDLADGSVSRLGVGEAPTWSFDGKRLAYVGDEAIHVRTMATGGERYLGRQPLYRSPGTLEERLFWSDDGRYIAHAPRLLDPRQEACEIYEVATGRSLLVGSRGGSCGPFVSDAWLAERQAGCPPV